jgi:transposase-like protein
MDRAWLNDQLSSGRSIEAIAREIGRHPSTVSYWANKHGLTSTHATRHAPRGGIDRDLLAQIVACGLSIRDMAEVMGRSPTTVRHWLRRHGLQSEPARRRAQTPRRSPAACKSSSFGASGTDSPVTHFGPTGIGACAARHGAYRRGAGR